MTDHISSPQCEAFLMILPHGDKKGGEEFVPCSIHEEITLKC